MGRARPGEVLADAAALLDEVDALSVANRARRDPDLEARLVARRHEAALALAHTDAVGAWPAPVEDRFADAAGLPEVDAADLDVAALRSAVWHHGALVVRGLVPAARHAGLRATADRAFAGQAADAAGEQPGVDGAYRPFDPGPDYKVANRAWVREAGAVWLADAPGALFEVLDVFEAAGLRRVLTEHLGGRPVFTMNKTTLRKVTAVAHPAWHQDGAFMGAGLRTVNVWVTLTDCGADLDVPGLDVVPRRLDGVVETGTQGAMLPNQVGPGTVERLARDAPVTRPQFAAGDALLFDDLFLHATGATPHMTGTRYTIESWFFAPTGWPSPYVPLVF
ncbi:MAG: phytanoyl-CoA dioxygenase family protein [Acidimicrobiales bacterium]|jgi:hypothetical protein|nr:phytanoyl-CoA dioxygenase family protein [Acidimicrobiales bacterium]